MKKLYEPNGLLHWDQRSIFIRNMIANYLVMEVTDKLKELNRAFEIIQCEAPILTPEEFINTNYTKDDVFYALDDLVLRPETTAGSYEYAKYLLSHGDHKPYKLPLCVWQHGKSFRKEQDKVLSHMRLKEFYQLEFQIIYSPESKCDYPTFMTTTICSSLARILDNKYGECHIELSDRLPSYSECTNDIVYKNNGNIMELASISQRTDFEGAKVLEIAIGTDRCVYQFINKL